MGFLDIGNPFKNGLSQGLSDPFGTNAANKANAANKKRYQQALGLWGELQGQQGTAYDAAGGYLKQGLGSINKGYGSAYKGLAGAGQTAKTNILQQGKQQLAGSQQSLASRGLYNTTAFDAAQRGIHADTSRALASVDESIGNMLANLQIGQGQAQAGAYGALSGLEQSRYGSLANLYGGKIGTITDRKDIAAPSLLQQAGPALGAFLGMA